MQSTVGMKSVPADMVVFDELDETTPAAKAMALGAPRPLGLQAGDRTRPTPACPTTGSTSSTRSPTSGTGRCGARPAGTWTALDKEFPVKLGQEVRIILPREDGTFYRACPKCSAELDLAAGEWVADFPDRPIHGYRISQLFSVQGRSRRDPRGVPHHPVPGPVLQPQDRDPLGGPGTPPGRAVRARSLPHEATPRHGFCVMGVDTGKELHVVILRTNGYTAPPGASRPPGSLPRRSRSLDALMERFHVDRCVIDGLPETHATREFAQRHRGRVFMNFFNENQRGAPKWDRREQTVTSTGPRPWTPPGPPSGTRGSCSRRAARSRSSPGTWLRRQGAGRGRGDRGQEVPVRAHRGRPLLAGVHLRAHGPGRDAHAEHPRAASMA